MNQRAWERIAGLAGMAFAVLLLVGIVPGGVPPAYGTDSKGVVDYFTGHGTGLQATFFLGNVLPTVLGSIFTGFLAVVIWKADADARFGAVVGVIGGTALGAFASSISIVWAMLVYGSAALGTSTPLASALYGGIVEANTASVFIEGLVPLGFGLAMRRLGGAWRVTGLIGVAVGLLNFAVGAVLFALTFKGGAVALLGVGTFVLWAIAAAALLALRGVSEPLTTRIR
jgi:hypothetical protein